MPNPNPKIFKRSLLAATVLSLSGCVTIPEMKEVDLSPIGAGILTAGRATANVGVHAWDVSMYLLGFSEEINEESDEATVASDDVGADEFLLEEAMLDEDGFSEDDLLFSEDELDAVEFPNATADADMEDIFAAPSDEEIAVFEETAENFEEDPFLKESDLEDDGFIDEDEFSDFEASNAKPASKLQKRQELVAVQTPLQQDIEERTATNNGGEFTHRVGPNETLWDIAKKTTGDATNWHVLADVNNLNQNANVFEGQNLVIPAKMLKPGYVDAVNGNGIRVAESRILIDTQDLSSAGSNVDLASVIDERSMTPASELSGQTVKLNAGETLWDFAKRTTGDATNWKAIASHNNFTEKQSVLVRAGQSISVPDSLAKPDMMIASASTPAKPVDSPEVTAELVAAIERANQSSIEASSELLAESSLSNAQLFADETQPITIVEATFKSDPTQQPIKIAADAADIASAAVQEPFIEQIMVSGTYYPKAIYNDADFSSSLLMRVSPGTTLQVSKAVGNWFEVTTTKGTGYVHKRDIK